MIYFDNAATTPISPKAAEAAKTMMTQTFGNPSSAHSLGLEAERVIKASTETIANILNVRSDEIFFTSGGTEANNLAIIGTVMERQRRGQHIITSQVEHPSVENSMKALEKEGFEVTRLPVNQSGEIDSKVVIDAIRDDTILVSLMHINNETGTIFDISNISRLVKEKNSKVIFHTDAVQAFCKEHANLKYVDLYALSAHKIHGLKGIGALFVRKGVRLKPMIYGGGQQRDVRPGTENTVGIASLAAAAESQIKNLGKIRDNVLAIKSEIEGIANYLEDVYINGSGSPYILNMSFLGIKGETLVHALESEGIFISSGAACNAKHPGQTSMSALKLGADRVDSVVRFSFSCFNTLEEARTCKETVIRTVQTLRKDLAR